MTAYYNENDPKVAQWLRNLIAEGLIAHGDVDDRSIAEVEPPDLRGYTQCHFFAGIGGWSLALRLAGWPDDRPVWTGSCPCQPFSAAGRRRAEGDARHLWPDWFRLICHERPVGVFGEQVASALGRAWLSAVRADLNGMGYAVGAADLPAACVGAPHIRQRLWWCADTGGVRSQGFRPPATGPWSREQLTRLVQAATRVSVPAGRDRALADGLPGRLVVLQAAGNAIVPQVAAEFIGAYLEVTGAAPC